MNRARWLLTLLILVNIALLGLRLWERDLDIQAAQSEKAEEAKSAAYAAAREADNIRSGRSNGDVAGPGKGPVIFLFPHAP
jgi:hypothetical protein